MKFIIFQITFILLPVLLIAQKLDLQVIGINGGTAQTNAGTIDWTLGELFTNHYVNNNIYLSEGFQQTWLSLMTPTKDWEVTKTTSLLVYPNPTTNFITVESDTDINIQLYDVYGRLVIDLTTVSETAQFNLSRLPAGLYLLRSFDKKGRLVDTVKVQRID